MSGVDLVDVTLTHTETRHKVPTRVNVGVKLIHIWLNERRFLQLHVLIEIPEAYPVVQNNGGQNKQNSEVPKVQLEESKGQP